MTLRARAVSFRYSRGRADVLRDVDLDLEPGCLQVIVGPNGAAKSTLLSVLAGSLSPSAGQVELDGRGLTSYTPRERARRLAHLSQDARVPFAFFAHEVVAMGRHAFGAGGRSRADATRRAREALAQLDSEGLGARVFNQLSGGERQRVLIARALTQCPERMLLDEPTSAQDIEHKILVFELCARLCAAGSSICVATHDLDIALQYATDLVVLADGALVARGPVEDILDAELMSRVFGVTGPVVTLPGGRKVLIPTTRRRGAP